MAERVRVRERSTQEGGRLRIMLGTRGAAIALLADEVPCAKDTATRPGTSNSFAWPS